MRGDNVQALSAWRAQPHTLTTLQIDYLMSASLNSNIQASLQPTTYPNETKVLLRKIKTIIRVQNSMNQPCDVTVWLFKPRKDWPKLIYEDEKTALSPLFGNMTWDTTSTPPLNAGADNWLFQAAQQMVPIGSSGWPQPPYDMTPYMPLIGKMGRLKFVRSMHLPVAGNGELKFTNKWNKIITPSTFGKWAWTNAANTTGVNSDFQYVKLQKGFLIIRARGALIHDESKWPGGAAPGPTTLGGAPSANVGAVDAANVTAATGPFAVNFWMKRVISYQVPVFGVQARRTYVNTTSTFGSNWTNAAVANIARDNMEQYNVVAPSEAPAAT